VRFVGEAEGQALNRDYRGKDYATNVLSFVYECEPVCGDLVLCAPVVAREAQQQNKTMEAHYAHLLVHGALHLQGFDHETAKQARRMEAREREIVTQLGYTDPYGDG
jgi:probable rRNA maturation factor